ncbi:WXG100 family type VII secretion target [Streptomyces sp. NPDC048281]|uniref:WXG100 family type VII secretion target n=1 Tax=Streptomyces sp. NPDC048281 TaxID=3154715 RepID=UPI00342B7E94
MSLPANYNTSSIAVDPWSLKSTADEVKTAVKGIGDDLEAIGDRMSDLRLSWAGDSADVMDDLNNRWNDNATNLFGTKDGTKPGILNTLSGGLTGDALNYSQTESKIQQMFDAFYNGLTGDDMKAKAALMAAASGMSEDQAMDILKADAASHDGDNVTDQVTDTYFHTTSVNEVF